jgi:hypothetical protein
MVLACRVVDETVIISRTRYVVIQIYMITPLRAADRMVMIQPKALVVMVKYHLGNILLFNFNKSSFEERFWIQEPTCLAVERLHMIQP